LLIGTKVSTMRDCGVSVL